MQSPSLLRSSWFACHALLLPTGDETLRDDTKSASQKTAISAFNVIFKKENSENISLNVSLKNARPVSSDDFLSAQISS